MNKIVLQLSLFTASALFFLSLCASAAEEEGCEQAIHVRTQTVPMFLQGNPLAAVAALENQNLHRCDSVRDYAAQMYAALGDYAAAYAIGGTNNSGHEASCVASIDSDHVRDAVESVAEVSADARIVVVNEIHHIPAHRAYGHNLIGRLHEQGYR